MGHKPRSRVYIGSLKTETYVLVLILEENVRNVKELVDNLVSGPYSSGCSQPSRQGKG